MAGRARSGSRRVRALMGQRFRGANRLAAVISWEAGKISPGSDRRIQEVIDICDFAVGLSRQLHGLTIASERRATGGGTIRASRRHHGV